MNFSSFKSFKRFQLLLSCNNSQEFCVELSLYLSPSSLPEKDLYQQANVNTREGQEREGPPFKCEVVFWQREM